MDIALVIRFPPKLLQKRKGWQKPFRHGVLYTKYIFIFPEDEFIVKGIHYLKVEWSDYLEKRELIRRKQKTNFSNKH